MPYVVENGAGVFTRSPKETARIVGEWFSTKTEELEQTSDNARKLAQPEAVFDIVKDIDELSEERGHLASVAYTLTSSFASLVWFLMSYVQHVALLSSLFDLFLLSFL